MQDITLTILETEALRRVHECSVDVGPGLEVKVLKDYQGPEARKGARG
jgi:hypothetical protein